MDTLTHLQNSSGIQYINTLNTNTVKSKMFTTGIEERHFVVG